MSDLPSTSASSSTTTSASATGGMKTRSGNILSHLPSTSTSTSKPATPSVKTRRSIESLWKIGLIGRTSHIITGAKLPSNRQVLRVLFYNMRFVKLTASESAKLAVNAVFIYWQQARIPTQYENKCIEKLLRLYEQWRKILKRVSGRSGAIINKQKKFVADLDDLFDIAHADALNQMRIEEDTKLLILQRQKGRPGCMAGVDMSLFGREKRVAKRKNMEQARKRKYDEMTQEIGTDSDHQ